VWLEGYGVWVYGCPEEMPDNRCLRWSLKITVTKVYGCPEDIPGISSLRSKLRPAMSGDMAYIRARISDFIRGYGFSDEIPGSQCPCWSPMAALWWKTLHGNHVLTVYE